MNLDGNHDRDQLHRFLFEHHSVRGLLVHLDATWQAVQAHKRYPPAVRDLLGEALAASALLSSTLKIDGRLTMQIQGDGPLSLLVAQCNSELKMRGMARCEDGIARDTLQSMSGKGRLAMTIEPRAGSRRYQGIVSLEGDRLADCLGDYFQNSEQLPTRLWLAANESCATGMLLQKLPEDERDVELDADAWARVQMLADTLTRAELMALKDADILRRLFHDEDVRLFSPKPVMFRCGCSRTQIEAVLRALGQDEIRDLIEEQESVRVDCEFCGRSYAWDAVDAERIFTVAPPPPPTIH